MYAVCLRHMLSLCPANDWRVVGTEQLNDESAGDILRAIWGLLYHREGRINVYHHGGGYLKDVVPESEIPTMVLARVLSQNVKSGDVVGRLVASVS